MPADASILNQLTDLLAKIRAFDDPRRASAEWKQAFNLLKKTDAEANHVANVIAMRDPARLAELIGELTPAPVGPDSGGDAGSGDSARQPGNQPAPIEEASLRSAMKAFRKRLKLMRLDAESQINSRSPLTSGKGASIDAIIPPLEYPREVWIELAKRGELRDTGQGFYALVKP